MARVFSVNSVTTKKNNKLKTAFFEEFRGGKSNSGILPKVVRS